MNHLNNDDPHSKHVSLQKGKHVVYRRGHMPVSAFFDLQRGHQLPPLDRRAVQQRTRCPLALDARPSDPVRQTTQG